MRVSGVHLSRYRVSAKFPSWPECPFGKRQAVEMQAKPYCPSKSLDIQGVEGSLETCVPETQRTDSKAKYLSSSCFLNLVLFKPLS